jgi:hypothetical protein
MERRDEFAAYVGPKADAYVEIFGRFAPEGIPRFAFSWDWPAFFYGVWWYLYRKMYLWAAVDFALSVIFGWTFFVPLLWAAARAMTGNYLYFLQADRAVRERESPRSAAGGASAGWPVAGPAGWTGGGPADLARLAREGGVHRWVAWAAVAGVVLLTVLSALFFGLLWKAVPLLQDYWPAPPGIPI